MTEKALLRVDLHAHTWFSADSLTPPATLIARARRAGLDRIAVTDHGAFAGALEAFASAPDLIIPGEEIRCAGGVHIIGLFLKELIPGELSLAETVRRIRDQGGVVYAPHPYAYVRNAVMRAEQAVAVADIVEVFNARAFLSRWNHQAAAAAQRARLPVAAGSDAHFPWEIGRTYTDLPAFTDARSFLAAVAEARPGATRVTSPFVHLASIATEGVRSVVCRGNGSRPRLRK